MHLRRWTSLLLLGLAAACSSASGGGGTSQTVLNGIFEIQDNEYAWAVFDPDGTYLLWSASKECTASDASEASCSKGGSYTFDPSTSVLTLTDASSGTAYTSTLAVSTLVPVATAADERLEVLGLTDGTSSLTSGSSSLTGSSSMLTSGSTNLLGGFSSTPLTSGSGEQLAGKGQWSLTAACQVLTIALGMMGAPIDPAGPDTIPVITQPAAPVKKKCTQG
jgi:hypothetical protein